MSVCSEANWNTRSSNRRKLRQKARCDRVQKSLQNNQIDRSHSSMVRRGRRFESGRGLLGKARSGGPFAFLSNVRERRFVAWAAVGCVREVSVLAGSS